VNGREAKAQVSKGNVGKKRHYGGKLAAREAKGKKARKAENGRRYSEGGSERFTRDLRFFLLWKKVR